MSLIQRAQSKRRYLTNRLRARLAAIAIPGLTVQGHTTFGPRCVIICAPGAQIRLRNTTIVGEVVLDAAVGARIEVGEALVAWRSIIAARELVTVADGVEIADHVTIRDHDHEHTPETGVKARSWRCAPVSIESGAWLASKVTVTRGVTVGTRALVAAGAVVTQDVEAGSVVGGVPARRLR